MKVIMTQDDVPEHVGESSPSSEGDAVPEGPLVYNSEELLRGRREVWIEHQGEMYRLRLTSRGRLYLTK